MLQHREPAWGHKANFIFSAKITEPDYAKQHDYEQMWGRTLGDNEYEVCCVPFALFDIFLGDVITLDEDLKLNKIVRRSGHLGFRVATKNKKGQEAINDELHAMGCITERFSFRLMAVDSEDRITAQEVADLLQRSKDEGKILDYETIKK